MRKLDRSVDCALVCDIDNNAVDFNHKTMKLNREQFMFPFILDVLNPSPAIGLNNEERHSFLTRIKTFAPDVTLALAVIHHMSLSGNVPFRSSAKFFANFSKYLIIEFPKRNDSWVQHLLKSKADFEGYFDFYTLENFEKAYLEVFNISGKIQIENSDRVMYMMQVKT